MAWFMHHLHLQSTLPKAVIVVFCLLKAENLDNVTQKMNSKYIPSSIFEVLGQLDYRDYSQVDIAK